MPVLVRPHIIRPPTFARSFNGTSDYAVTSTLPLSGVVRFSLVFWFYQITLSGLGMICELSTDGGSDTGGFFIDTGSYLESNSWLLQEASGSITYGNLPSTGAWHHWVFTFDMSTSTKVTNLYIDGVSQTVSSYRGGSATSLGSYPLYLMCRAGTSNFNNANLAEFGLISNYLVSAGEAEDLYIGKLSLARVAKKGKPSFLWRPRTFAGPDIDQVGGAIVTLGGTAPAPWQQRITA